MTAVKFVRTPRLEHRQHQGIRFLHCTESGLIFEEVRTTLEGLIPVRFEIVIGVPPSFEEREAFSGGLGGVAG
jgi:hypothetical protein